MKLSQKFDISCHKTDFITRHGLFEHIRMGFGLCNAPATLTRAMQSVLHGLLWGDVIVLGLNFEVHLTNLAKVFQRLRRHNLKLKPRKCVLFREEVKFLGKIVSRKGISVNPENIERVSDWPIPMIPKNVNEVEIFLDFMNYHREHLKDYAKKAAPLYQLTGSNGKAVPIFVWSDYHQVAFEECYVQIPYSWFPFGRFSFYSSHGCFLQIQDGKKRPISFGSFGLTAKQRNYCTTRKELLALVRFTRQYRQYLLSAPTIIV